MAIFNGCRFSLLTTVLCFFVSLLTLTIGGVSVAETIQTERLGLPPISQVPPKQQVEIGKRLFFDLRLSGNGSVSCGTCHQPDKAFADGKPLAEGIKRQKGTRNTPSIVNSAFLTSFFWDGRRTSLVDQAKDPFINPAEHGLASHDQLMQIVREDAEYRKAFRLGSEQEHSIALEQVAEAIAAFVRSLVSGNSAFDRYFYGHDHSALSSEAILGLELFRGKARCDTCHVIGSEGAIFTDGQFHRLGIGTDRIQENLAQLTGAAIAQSKHGLDHRILSDPDMAELGRFLVTHDPKDIGKFKTPSLRNVALTAPYMHDGSVPTLEAAVDRELYYRSLESGRPILLSPREKAALVEFLHALSSRPPKSETP